MLVHRLATLRRWVLLEVMQNFEKRPSEILGVKQRLDTGWMSRPLTLRVDLLDEAVDYVVHRHVGQLWVLFAHLRIRHAVTQTYMQGLVQHDVTQLLTRLWLNKGWGKIHVKPVRCCGFYIFH